jgi:hypothetical protein
MSMNSFRELQNVYENYRGDFTNYPDKTFPIQQSQVSYRKGELPTATPGQGIKTFTVSNNPYGLSEDEDESMIPKSVIVSKLNELLSDAEEKGMTYASSQLMSFLSMVNKM